ncbi:MAG: amidohydrolase family protein [Pseudomonadota bacterium]|nr:amidohydrolase family protein [Pseudomonadota bacterium]
MRIIDVDAHFHEPVDWVAHTDPGLANAIGTPPPRFIDVVDSVFGIGNPALKALPDGQVPDKRVDTILPGFTQHLEMTQDRQPDLQAEAAEDPVCAAEARLAFCDERGIDVQFLNPSFLVSTVVQAANAKRFDLMRDIRACWNQWASDQVFGHTDRLIPVTQIDLSDIPWSIAQMTRMRDKGSRAFQIPEAPVGNPRLAGGPEIAKSITHPDFDPIWSAAVDLGMAAFAHVGFGRESINNGWANNGGEDLSTYSFLNMVVAPQLAPQLLLSAMVFDGLFERFPKLTVVVEEVGISWLPHLLHVLDGGVGRHPLSILEDSEYRPDFAGAAYKLPLAPSEYLRRQVRVTPLVATQPLKPTIDVAPEMLCFSSDYPHVEGAAEAVATCDRQLEEMDEDRRAAFYGGVGEMIGL